MPNPNDMGFAGLQRPETASSELNARTFFVKMLIGQMSTATIVAVISVTNDGELSPVGFVDIRPLVNLTDGAGNTISHNTVFSCPYMRIQGGDNAVILDPRVGDIGIAVIADHDISSVCSTKSSANPGSLRRFNLADSMYVGGILNGTPVQYIQFNSDGISIVSPTKVTISAPNILLDGTLSQGTGPRGGTATLLGPVIVTNDLMAQGTDVHTHTHGGVTTGSGNTAGPN